LEKIERWGGGRGLWLRKRGKKSKLKAKQFAGRAVEENESGGGGKKGAKIIHVKKKSWLVVQKPPKNL